MLLRIDGMRVSDAEALLQLQQQGIPIGIKGLLVGGVVIRSLGAVMDVAMGIASSLSEVGTMTNTLILALLGSDLVLIIYLYSLGLSPNQLLSSAYLSIEVINSISSSIGVILSIPLTAMISSIALAKNNRAQ